MDTIVTELRVGRTYRTREYESSRLDIVVQVRPGQPVSDLLSRLEDILDRLRPVLWTPELANAYDIYQKWVQEGSPQPVDSVQQWAQDLLSKYRGDQDIILAARQELDKLGAAIAPHENH